MGNSTMLLNITELSNILAIVNITTSWSTQSHGLTALTTTTTEEYGYDYYGYYTDDLTLHEPCVYRAQRNHILPVLYSLFFLVGFFGNVLVLWVIMMGAQLKSMTDVCLLNLALADLLLVLSLPFLAHYANNSWIFGQAMCKLVLGMYYVGFYGGIFFIVLMSIDRYLAVVHAVFALRVRTKMYGILASLIIWIISVSASFPELVYIQTVDVGNDTICTAYLDRSLEDKQDHSLKVIGLLKMNILGLVVPLLIVGYCYTMVLMRLLTIRTAKKYAMRLVILVMVVFFCCWTPYNITAFLKGLELMEIIHTDCNTSKMIQSSLQITEALAYSHSCLNPFLYVFVGEKFKRHLIRLLRRTPFNKLQFMKIYLTQATGSMYSQTTSVDERSTAI
ncbi:C-C chemokine receptor type 4-like [Hoplias malabaricus]|uniref:C-C chemokine receptor type 4-like n=1 Tax=Hoplias malabaricus TaxID=27720 RepID=UPI0034633D3D